MAYAQIETVEVVLVHRCMLKLQRVRIPQHPNEGDSIVEEYTAKVSVATLNDIMQMCIRDQWSFRKPGIMGTLASQAKIGVLVQASRTLLETGHPQKKIEIVQGGPIKSKPLT